MTQTKKTLFAVILSIAVAVIALTIAFAIPASAATSGTCGASANEGGAESVTWTLDDNGVLTISGTGAMADFTSASKQPWYSSRSSITSIVVEDGVTTIGKYAFRESKAVTVTLGKDVTTIGDYTFYNCTAMTSISGLDNVTTVKQYAFYGCSKLASVTLGDVTSIGASAFKNCSALNTVKFGSTAATAKALVIPETVTSIGSDAFYGCRSFTSAVLPTTITSVPGYLFYNCSGLTSVTLKGEVTSIGNSAFSYCERLYKLQFGDTPAVDHKLAIPSSVTTLGTSAFYGTQFTSADLTDTGWIALPASSFYGCMELKEVYLPTEMKEIGSAAFRQCYELGTVQWEGATATEGVIDIPEGVTLGASAFRYCTSVKEFILPSTLTKIPDYLFHNCYNTEKITFKGDITAIGNYAFGNDSAIANYENLKYIDFNGTKSTNGDIVLPASLKTIGNYAFQYNGSVKSAVIPEGVTSIGQNAFLGCANLTKATINNTSATVGANAFKNCAATFCAELPYLCSGEGVMAMREAIIASGVSKGAVKIGHTDADNDGCCDVATCYDSKENGYIIVSGGVKDVDYTYSGGILTILKNGTYTVASSFGDTAIEESIVISAGLDNVTLILNGLNIFTSDAQNAIFVDSSAELPTKVTITLSKDSVNTLKSGVGSALVGADCAVVTVNGEGSLTVNGGNNTSTSSSSSGGAGIEMYTDGVFIVDSGTITANGGSGYNGGPGIGVSRNKASTRSVYIINGGTVTANGGATTQSDGKRNSPGFGGSYGLSYAYSGGAYVVNGGTLIATGGIREGDDESTRGAGIGNYCCQIQLISGNVTAKGGSTLGDIYMYTGSSNSTYYSYWNTIDNLTLTNDKINLGTKVKSAVIDHEAKTITIPSVSAQSSPYLGYLYFCFYGDLVVPDGYTLMGSKLTLCYNSSLTVSEGAFVDDSFSYLDSIIYSKGMKFAKWLCPYEGVRTDDDLFVYPHGTDSTGEEYAKIYSTFSIKSIYYDLSTLNNRADLKARTKTCTDLPITLDIKVISLDTSVVFVEGYDYELTYNNNILPGIASYTVTPLEGGRMIGDPVTVEFTITARALTINKPATAYMQAGGNALDALPKSASAIYAHIDKTPQEIQNGKFTWYVDAERTTLLTNEYGAALEAGEYTVYWTYSHKHTGFENNLTGETILKVTEKTPQQIEIDGIGVVGGVISLFSKGGNTTPIVKFDLSSVITVNGEPINDHGTLTWAVNGIAPVDGVSAYVLDDDDSVSVDQNGHLTIVGMSTDTVIVTLTAAETESYAPGVGQITININPAGFRLHFEGSAGDVNGSGSGGSSSSRQEIIISGVTVDHKIYDGQPVSYNGTPVATLSDGTPVTPSGEYTFTYYKQTGLDEGDALDHTPYAVGNYWLIITYSDASYKGEYKTEFIIAHREISVKSDGTLTSGTLVEGHTVASMAVDASEITEASIEDANGNDVSFNYLVLFESEEPKKVKIEGASIIVGKDITMNYYVSITDEELLADLDNIYMRFTRNGKMVTVKLDAGNVLNDGWYIFPFTNISPQCMGDNIKAELLLGETVIATKDEYSVKQNLSNLLKNNASDETLVQLITDMLTYGVAAQQYAQYNTDAPVTEGVEGMGTPSSRVPEKTDRNITTHVETLGDVRFTAVNVWFDNVNKIGVKLSTTENARLFVDGAEITLGDALYYYTDSIRANEFDKILTFTLYEGETLVQTLTYSVSSYVYSMQSSEKAEMKALANALYNYGVSAKAYQNSQN